MEPEIKEILDEIISKYRVFSAHAKMYKNDDAQAKEFIKMIYEQSHVKYLRENFGEDLMKKIELYCSTDKK